MSLRTKRVGQHFFMDLLERHNREAKQSGTQRPLFAYVNGLAIEADASYHPPVLSRKQAMIAARLRENINDFEIEVAEHIEIGG